MPVQLLKAKDKATAQLNAGINNSVLSIPLKSGEGANFPQPYAGTATSTGSRTVLNDTGDLGSLAVGDFIRNVTDGSWAFVTSIASAPNSVTTTRLEGGSDNTWSSGDVWRSGEFVITIASIDADGEDTAYEEALISDRSTDTLTVPTGGRGFNGTTAQSFLADDYVQLRVSAPYHEELRELLKEFKEVVDTNTTNTTNLQTGSYDYVVATGSSNAYVAATPALTAYAAGNKVRFKANHTNSGPATLNVNGLGAQAIKKIDGATALTSGDIVNGQIVVVQYDGTNFQMLSPVGQPDGSTLSVSDKTADYTVLDTEPGKLFTNNGASADVVLSLPATAAGLNYEFAVVAANVLAIRLNSSSTQSVEDAASTYIGYWSKTTHSATRIAAPTTTKWLVTSKNGTWTGMVRRGYWGGGFTGSNIDVIGTLLYSDESRTNLSAVLPSARRTASGVSGVIAGYMMGGFIAANTSAIAKLKFTDETCAALAATLDTAAAFEHEGVQSSTKGYTTHSTSGSTAIEDITFSTDASAVIAAAITNRSSSSSTTHRDTAGYFAGGGNGGSQDDIYKLLFSNETISTVSNLLPANVTQQMGNVYSSTIGYFAGGAGIISTIYKLTFSGETTGTVADTLDEARKTGGGITQYAAKGYFIGGEEGGGATNEIAGFTFSGETCADIAATLSASAYLQGSGMMNIAY